MNINGAFPIRVGADENARVCVGRVEVNGHKELLQLFVPTPWGLLQSVQGLLQEQDNVVACEFELVPFGRFDVKRFVGDAVQESPNRIHLDDFVRFGGANSKTGAQGSESTGGNVSLGVVNSLNLAESLCTNSGLVLDELVLRSCFLLEDPHGWGVWSLPRHP